MNRQDGDGATWADHRICQKGKRKEGANLQPQGGKKRGNSLLKKESQATVKLGGALSKKRPNEPILDGGRDPMTSAVQIDQEHRNSNRSGEQTRNVKGGKGELHLFWARWETTLCQREGVH